MDGPDSISGRILRLFISTSTSPEARVSGLSVFTHLVRNMAHENLPEETIPVLWAATLLPIQPLPGKILAIAIAQVLRMLVTKFLLHGALVAPRDYFLP